MTDMVKIDTQFGSAGTIKTLQEVLVKRMVYMNETARDSIAAFAINVLKSIRTITKVAKPSKMKVEVKKEGGLYPSCTMKGGHKTLCLRVTGTKQRYSGPETMVGLEKAPLKNQGVYRFVDEHNGKRREYLIVAPSMGAAKNKAKQIRTRRGMRFAGLAKRALGILMFKTNTKRVNDSALNPLVENVANDVTDKREWTQKSGENGIYTLELTDKLEYAKDAVRGGYGAVEAQMKKAANRIVSIINQKLKSNRFLSNERLETPFPEVAKRRK